MNDIVIFGDTSFAAIVAEYINSEKENRVVAFTLDAEYINDRKTFEGVPLVAFEHINEKYPPENYKLLIAVSAGSKAKHLNSKKFDEAKSKGYQFFTFIHSTSFIADTAKLGENVLIFPHVIVEPRAIINNGVIVRSAAYVSHETEIGAFSYLAPRATFSGKIKTGSHCFFGTNSTIRDGLTIGDDVIIGAGATALKNLDNQTVLKVAESVVLPVDRFKLNV
jgi:sugar O-acyltransferase (sialic acid O-acetyltransferase NeuD family)